MAAPNFHSIPVDQIVLSRRQARKNIPDDSISRLASSIKAEGLLQPITVRSIPEVGSGGQLPAPKYELVAGERRWRAVKFLGLPTIRAKIIETVTEAEAAAKGIMENLQREDLNPIEEAQGLADLNRLDGNYWTQEKIAEVTGKTQSHISETLRILDLPELIRENIRRRIISPEHAAELLRLPTTDLQLMVAKKIEQGLTRDKTRKLINYLLEHKQAGESKHSGRPRKDPFASLWPNLLAGAAIDASGAWRVAFKRDKWDFQLDAKAFSSKEALARWFKQVGDAIAGSPVPQTQEPGKSNDGVAKKKGTATDAKRAGK